MKADVPFAHELISFTIADVEGKDMNVLPSEALRDFLAELTCSHLTTINSRCACNEGCLDVLAVDNGDSLRSGKVLVKVAVSVVHDVADAHKQQLSGFRPTAEIEGAMLSELQGFDDLSFSSAQVKLQKELQTSTSHPTRQPTLSSQYQTKNKSFLNKGSRSNLLVACIIVGSCFLVFLLIAGRTRMHSDARAQDRRLYPSG